MKYIFTLILGGLFTSAAFANNITLSFTGSRNYQVLIDGRPVSTGDYYRNTVYLNDLRYGSHTLEVYRMRRHGGWGWNGGSSSQLTYSAPFRVMPQLDLSITIDDRGRAFMNESRCGDWNRDGDFDRDDHGGFDRNDNRGGYDRDDNRGDRNDNRSGYPPSNNGGYDNGGYNNNNGGYNNNNGGYNNNNGGYNNSYNRAMSDMDFNALLQRVRNQWMGKINTARDAVSSNYFTTAQVRQLLQLFSSERDRLDLAKLAYDRTTDKQNFRQLYDLFSYQGQDELDTLSRSGR